MNCSHRIMFLIYTFIIFYPQTQNNFKHIIVLPCKQIGILERDGHQNTRCLSIRLPYLSRPNHSVNPTGFPIALFVPVLYPVFMCETGMEAWRSKVSGFLCHCWRLNNLIVCKNRCFDLILKGCYAIDCAINLTITTRDRR